MTQTTAQRFELRDGMQPVGFYGEQLAAASSQTDDYPQARWTELAIYRTVTGKYVLEKVGRSDLVHTDPPCETPGRKPGKGALPYANILAALEDVDEDASVSDMANYFLACSECKPSFDNPDAPVIVEQDMHSVDSFADAEGLVDALHYRKNGSVRSLSSLSRTLLDEAAKKDKDIARVRNRPTEIS